MLDLTTDYRPARSGQAVWRAPWLQALARCGLGWTGAGLGLFLLAGSPASSCKAATFIVSNTLDSGSGSLRQALLNANASNGLDTITFQIPGAGTHTISPHSALPTVTDAVVIDGTSQPGFAGPPLIELDGANAGASSSGLRMVASNCVVRGLAINRFGAGGLRIEGLGGNSIQGNLIGLDVTGTLSRPNGEEGVFVSSSWNNLIGGTNAAERNVISGNGDAGIYLYNGGSNVISGNFIGTTAGGRTRSPNSNNGVIVYDSADNVIGGVEAGGGNVIAGNGGSGIYLFGAGSTGNVVQGNYLGTDATGSLALGNTADGVTISGAPSNVIGGTASGAGNLILANSEAGVFITGSTATNNVVQGNNIGTGGQALGNSYAGLTISVAGANLIGGTAAGAGNLISGNVQDGIFVTNSTGILIQGNRIGVNPAGTGATSNGANGITIAGTGSNVIGGTVSGAGNVISGNLGNGICLYETAGGNLIQGNYVGTDVSGRVAVNNGLAGVLIEGAGNTVGGLAGGAGNVISGNGLDGVWIAGATAASNVVAGNFVGTDATGSSRLGNSRAGVGISEGPGNWIGGGDEGAGNVISANGNAGIYIIGNSASGNVVQGNKVGTDISGLRGLGNATEGIYVESASTNTLGGVTPGAGNLISANFEGIWLTNASWNVVLGNWIGVSADGVSGLGNVEFGVLCEVGANHNVIGGTGPGAGNRIGYSVSPYAGMRVRNGAANNAILGNSIFANGGLGIDLGAYGVTAAVPCDAGTTGMANLGQNYPVLTQAISGTYGTRISGTLNSVPNSVFLLEFFADPLPAPSGYGQGQVWLGDTTVVTGADCNTPFVALLANPVPAGFVVTATATDAANNSSEFSEDIPAATGPGLEIARLFSSSQQQVGPSGVVLTWTNTLSLVLQETSSLQPPYQWTTSANVPSLTSSNRWVVGLTNSPANRFYRLSLQ
ncbi:MAG: beta strand repeat-containing protein [Limisphaerales bacterium]